MIEAHEARVPLLVLTADRPPELRDLGAGQTIDQVKLYGSAAKWYLEVDDARGHAGAAALAAPARLPRVLDRARRPPRPRAPELLAARAARARRAAARRGPGGGGRAGGRPWVTRPRVRAEAGAALVDAIAADDDRRARAPVLVAGRAERDPQLGAALAAFAERAAIPLLADPLSGARRGAAAVAHYDALLRDADWAAAHAPDLVLRVGDLPTSKPLRQWLHGLDDALQIAFDPENAWQDPARRRRDDRRRRPALDARATVGERLPPRRDRGWLDGWRRADRRGRRRRSRATLDPAGLSEPRVAAELGRAAAARGHARGRVLDAGARRRDVLPGPRATRRACSPTAAPTGSTGPSRPPSAPPRPRRTGPSCC